MKRHLVNRKTWFLNPGQVEGLVYGVYGVREEEVGVVEGRLEHEGGE